jgi:RNA polymerase sigma factor (sigma-70 family)
VASQAPDDGFTAVLAAARTGDAAAWSALYHATAPMLVAYLRAQRLPDPDDVAGEVLLEVVRDLHRFDGDERGFRSWVLAIAHHRLLDARRRALRRPDESGEADELLSWPGRDDTEAEGLAAVGLGELAPALAELTADQRTVLLLRVVGETGIAGVFGDLVIADSAEVLGKRAGAVKQLQRRAVATLQRRLRHVPPGARAEDDPTTHHADVAVADRLLEVVADAHVAADRGRRDG